MLGWKCYKFEYNESIDENVYKLHTMWVRYPNSSEYPTIPLRYEVRGFDTVLGRQYDHYRLDYNYYTSAKIPGDVFKIVQGTMFIW